MFYEYLGEECPNAPRDEQGRRAMCHHLVQLPVAKMQPCGATRKCELKGCRGRITRVMSTNVGIIIRGNTEVPWNPNESVMTRINGQDVKFTFVDHPQTDPKLRNRLAQVAAKAGVRESNGIGKAYYNEKMGRMCVDVASNIPDPLGAFERQKKQGDVERVTKKVNQPYKLRKRKK